MCVPGLSNRLRFPTGCKGGDQGIDFGGTSRALTPIPTALDYILQLTHNYKIVKEEVVRYCVIEIQAGVPE